VRATALVAAGALVVLLAGCGADDAGRAAPDAPDSTASAGSGGSVSGSPSATATLGLDPAMAVAPPGPREDALRSADLLVFGEEALDDETLHRLEGLDGVAAVTPISLAQVTIENHAVNVAGVDPATYRLFTELRIADKQAIWDRVAGGELAVVPALKRRMTDEGYLRLGVSKDAPEVHVGALAEQIPQVDIVLNEKWGRELGMTPGNAALIWTGVDAPAQVRRPVQRIVGDDVSVQRLDIAARLGLDTSSPTQTAFFTGGSVAGVVGTFTYTVLDGGRIAPESSWVGSHISTQPVPILGQMTCNRAIFPQLRAALTEIQERGLAGEIHPDEYAGCYYPRFIAGTTTLSNHAFGLAFDLNVPGNQRGTVGEIDRTVVSIFEKWGFGWGGHWGWTDPMHFEMNAIVTPG
jgi:D-alanyl-D-alanine carboxypeptidase